MWINSLTNSENSSDETFNTRVTEMNGKVYFIQDAEKPEGYEPPIPGDFLAVEIHPYDGVYSRKICGKTLTWFKQ